MAKHSLHDFSPELRVVAPGTASKRLVVVFDTNTDIDLKRSPRIVMIDTEGVTDIRTEVSNVTCEGLVVRALYRGQINLLTKKGDGDPTSYLLADFEMEIEGTGKRDKAGSFIFPPETEIAQFVRQGVADAFTDASLEMIYSTASPVQTHAQELASPSQWLPRPAMAYAGAAAGPAPSAGSKRSGPTKNGLSKKAAWAIGVMLLLLSAAAIKIMVSSGDPVQSAVNKALAQDPRARDEQIEITRNTLKEMGLDPGKNGDLGCLAAP